MDEEKSSRMSTNIYEHIFVDEVAHEDLSDSKLQTLLEKTAEPTNRIHTRTYTGALLRKRYAKAAKGTRKEQLKKQQEDPLVQEAMYAEIKDLTDRGAWKVEYIDGRKTITSTWAHKYKTDRDGNFLRVKSRICPHGFKQIAGVHYNPKEVAAPTPHIADVLLFLALVIKEKCTLRFWMLSQLFPSQQ